MAGVAHPLHRLVALHLREVDAVPVEEEEAGVTMRTMTRMAGVPQHPRGRVREAAAVGMRTVTMDGIPITPPSHDRLVVTVGVIRDSATRLREKMAAAVAVESLPAWR